MREESEIFSWRSPLTEKDCREPSRESLAEMLSAIVTCMESRSWDKDARADSAFWADTSGWEFETRGALSSTWVPRSPRTRSNISVAFDFLPSCMPLLFGAIGLAMD